MVKNKCLAVFAAAAILSAALRIVEMLALTEYETGFIRREKTVAFYAISVIIAILIAFAAAYAVKNNPQAKSRGSFYLVTSVCSLLAGVALILEIFGGEYSGVPYVLRMLCMVFAALSALYFFAFALRAAVYLTMSPKLSVIPIAFFIVKSAAIFIRGSYHAVINETLLEVGLYCFSMLFFLEAARSVNGLGDAKSVKKFTVFGILASLFSLIYSVPQIIVSLFYSDAMHSSSNGVVLPLFIGLYIACLVFSRITFTGESSGQNSFYYSGRH